MTSRFTRPVIPPHIAALLFSAFLAIAWAGLTVPWFTEAIEVVLPYVAIFAAQIACALLGTYLAWALIRLPMPRWASAMVAVLLALVFGALMSTLGLHDVVRLELAENVLFVCVADVMLSSILISAAEESFCSPVGALPFQGCPFLRNLLLLRWVAWVEEGELAPDKTGAYVCDRHIDLVCRVRTSEGTVKEVPLRHGVVLRYSDDGKPMIKMGPGGVPVVTMPVPSPSCVPYRASGDWMSPVIPFEDGSWLHVRGGMAEFQVMGKSGTITKRLDLGSVTERDDRVPHYSLNVGSSRVCVPKGACSKAGGCLEEAGA